MVRRPTRDPRMIALAGRRGRNQLARQFAMVLVCAGGLVCDATGAESAPVRKPATHTILIDGVKYVPATLTVKVGEAVVWINKDPFPHTVTASGSFDSHAIAAGKSWKWTPRKAGDYSYVCTLH